MADLINGKTTRDILVAGRVLQVSVTSGSVGVHIIDTDLRETISASKAYGPFNKDVRFTLNAFTAVASYANTTIQPSDVLNAMQALNTNIKGVAGVGGGKIYDESGTELALSASSQLGNRTVIFGDSITLRHWNSIAGCTVSASGGVATVVLGTSSTTIWTGNKVKVYQPGQMGRSIYGDKVVASRISATSFTFAYDGPDVPSESCSVAFESAYTDTSYFTHLNAALNQRLNLVNNAGVGGETSDQILARVQTDVVPYAPNIVIYMAGTNDFINGVDVNTTINTIKTTITQLMATADLVICLTAPPLGSSRSSTERNRARDAAKALKDYCALYPNKLACVDVFGMGVTKLATSSSADSNVVYDQIHLNPNFALRVGKAIAAVISPKLAPWVPKVTSLADTVGVNSASGNMIANSLMLDTNADGTADGVTLTTATLASAVPSVIANPSGYGNLQQVVCTADAANDVCTIELASILSAMQAQPATKKYRIAARIYVTNPVNLSTIAVGMNMTVGGQTYNPRAISSLSQATGLSPYADNIEGFLYESGEFIGHASLSAAIPTITFVFSGAGSATVAVGEVFTEITN